MKNKPIHQRFKFALQGIRNTWTGEPNFRIQSVLGGAAIGLLIYLQAQPLWWAIVILVIGSILAAEMFNTALEKTLDLLHPELHPMIGLAKDCAAGAVLILSLASVGILIALICSHLK